MPSPPPPPPTVETFVPTSRLGNGRPGLFGAPGSPPSSAKITGTGLTNRDTATVVTLANSPNPGLTWTGPIRPTGNTNEWNVPVLTLQTRGVSGRPQLPTDDPTNVSVTVGTANLPSTTVNVGTAPLVETGTYSIKCLGSPGDYVWLAGTSSGGVNLQNKNDTPQNWTLGLVNSPNGDCYTLQVTLSGTTYYLNWLPDGTVNISETGPNTNWHVIADPTPPEPGAVCIKATCDPEQFLHGTTTDEKKVKLIPDATGHAGAGWTLGRIEIA